MNTGIWNFSGRRTSDPREYPQEMRARAAQFQEDLKFITGEDAGFRELFALAGSKPYPRDEAAYACATEGLAVPLRHIAFAL
jgi:hypothetical protein